MGNMPEEMARIWDPVLSKQEKLAQLGARVLEILESTPEEWRAAIERADYGMNGIASRTIGAARSLGLLGEETPK